MKRLILAATLLGLCVPWAAADDQAPTDPKPERPPVAKKTPDELPDGIAKFNGMLVGRLVDKDVERGIFVLNVDAVPRVWRNSRAANPKSIVGKNVEVDGVSGKWLDVLLVVKEGETLECEARHDGGQRLTFPGELLRKVAPYDPQDYPVLPENFRGFRGGLAAKIVQKDPETFELILQVDRVLESWEGSGAKDAQSIVGKRAMLAGFWQRKEQYHGLEVGDVIEVGVQHINPRSDHLNVAEFVRKTSGDSDTPDTPRPDSNDGASEGGLPEGMKDLYGSLAVGDRIEAGVQNEKTGTDVLQVIEGVRKVEAPVAR